MLAVVSGMASRTQSNTRSSHSITWCGDPRLRWRWRRDRDARAQGPSSKPGKVAVL